MKTIEIPETENDGIALLKKRNPKMRRTNSTAICRSGGRQTIFDCVCGARHTTSTGWNGRSALHVRVWRGEHSDCAIKEAKRLLIEDLTKQVK
jgi:hypothetical protein